MLDLYLVLPTKSVVLHYLRGFQVYIILLHRTVELPIQLNSFQFLVQSGYKHRWTQSAKILYTGLFPDKTNQNEVPVLTISHAVDSVRIFL